jgi:hypothetical protein
MIMMSPHAVRPSLVRLLLPLSTTYRSLTLSAVEGPQDRPLIAGTLYNYFSKEVVGRNGARPALIARNEVCRAHGGPVSPNLGVSHHLAWDFDEFDRHINALARGLISLGVKKGDRVGVVMGNNR